MSVVPRLTVVGSLNIDISAAAPALPAPGETVGQGVISRRPGGKGANQAAAAARLGGHVRMHGCVGRDTEGDQVQAALAEAGVDLSGLQAVDTPTGTGLIVVDHRGENQIVVCPGANEELDSAEVELGTDAVLLQLETPMEVVRSIVARAQGFVVLNAAPAAALPAEVLARVDLVVVNESEYSAMPALREARRVAVTLGAAGAVLVERGREVAHADGVPATVVSTVGAGDAFTATLTVALLAGAGEKPALRTACRVASAVVTSPDAQPPLGTLTDYLADHWKQT